MFEFITRLDFKILDFIIDHIKCGFLDKLMPVITLLADNGIVPIIIAVVLICIPKTRKTGIAMGIAFVFGGLIGNVVLKNVIGRGRPYDMVTGIELLIPALSDFSFPSGHTLVCFEAAMVLYKREKRAVGITALVLASAVAFSRLYLYVHYPSDVIAGILLGILFGVIGSIIVDNLGKTPWVKSEKQ